MIYEAYMQLQPGAPEPKLKSGNSRLLKMKQLSAPVSPSTDKTNKIRHDIEEFPEIRESELQEKPLEEVEIIKNIE